jgi:tetratricopeptide (TPR) repeat protein
MTMAAKKPELIPHRTGAQNEAAMLFIHGFSGDIAKTWGNFPKFLGEDMRLNEWDIYSLGYNTGLSLDIVGIWSANPDLEMLAGALVTRCGIAPLNRYKSLTLIAHSMGGLIVQRAVLDDTDLRDRVAYVLMFGTPSGGLKKASFLKFWKRQLRDMADDGPFVTGLRKRWASGIGDNPDFKLYAVAGYDDQFVPPNSSIEPFPPRARKSIRGNHLSIVKPEEAGDPSVQIVIETLVGKAPASGPGNSARVAVEMGEFRKAIKLFQDHPEALDQGGLVQLALALESVGNRDKAIELLQSRKDNKDFTDALGTLGGRLKRRWLVKRTAADAKEALELYQRGLQLSEAKPNYNQAFYHAINVAFLRLAYEEDKPGAKAMAEKALEHCRQANQDCWSLATEGEANLLLGNIETSMKNYQAALDAEPKPWQVDSMFQQAIKTASLVGNKTAAEQLVKMFRGDA